mmetsp:Transcript_10616/g.20028  ORF Transcript_10616/g.20028 Transcript_10616/m.20028 type:complete len:205 (-) Transcript_10616:536-1150(-)
MGDICCARSTNTLQPCMRLQPKGCLPSDLQQFHIKDQDLVRPNDIANSFVSVSQIRGNVQLPFGPNLHQAEGLRPSLDHSVHRKLRGLPSSHGTVKHGAINQLPFVVHFHGAGIRRRLPGPRLNHFILQPRLGGCDLWALIVLHQELDAFHHHSFCRFLLFGLDCIKRCLQRVYIQLHGTLGESIFEALIDGSHVDPRKRAAAI